MIVALLSRLASAQEPCIPIDVAALTAQARARMLDEDFARARQAIAQAEQGIACADSHLWPHQLSTLYQTYAAIVAQLDGDDEARRWYERAARIAPSVPFDPKLYPGGRAAFQAALDESRAELSVSVSSPAGAILDGIFLPPGEVRAVSPGEHIVQYLSPAGRLVTESAALQAGAVTIGAPLPLPAEELPAQARPATRLVGTGLVLTGGAVVGASAWWHQRAGEYRLAEHPDAQGITRTANLLTAAGLGAIVAGTGLHLHAVRSVDATMLSLTVTR